MRTTHLSRLLSSALGLAVLGLLWFYLAPSALGGSTTYVVTHGVSMEPRFHTGDLAVVRARSHYNVGEVVAYDSKMLGTVVLHRIIGQEGDRYLFKGDNNNFVDFEHPMRDQLIGSLWFHVAGVGATLQSIRSPALMGVLIALGVLLFTGVAFTKQRRTRRKRHVERGEQAAHGPVRISRVHRPAIGALSTRTIGVLALAGAALAPFAVLALVSFTRASSARTQVKIPYKQSGTFSYRASAQHGPTYAGDRAVTGDPLFTRVLDAVDLRFQYAFEGTEAKSLKGRTWLSATMSATDGWQASFPLGSPSTFSGPRALAAATIHLSSLLGLIRRVQLETGVNSSYKLTVTPHVTTTGTMAGAPLHATFAPKLLFAFSPLEVQPIASKGSISSSGQSTKGQFDPTSSGTVTGSRSRADYMSFGPARVSVSAARGLSLGGIVLVIFLAVAAIFFRRPPIHDRLATIRGRYGHLIVPVTHVSELSGVPVIDVTDMDALARVAEQYDRSILHATEGGRDSFWVTDESGQFRFTLDEQPLSAIEPQPGEHSRPGPTIAQQPVASAESSPPIPREEPVTAVHPTPWAPERRQPGSAKPAAMPLPMPQAKPAGEPSPLPLRTAASALAPLSMPAPMPAPMPTPAPAPLAMPTQPPAQMPTPNPAPLPTPAFAAASTGAPVHGWPNGAATNTGVGASNGADGLTDDGLMGRAVEEVYADELEMEALTADQPSRSGSPKRPNTSPTLASSTGSSGNRSNTRRSRGSAERAMNAVTSPTDRP